MVALDTEMTNTRKRWSHWVCIEKPAISVGHSDCVTAAFLSSALHLPSSGSQGDAKREEGGMGVNDRERESQTSLEEMKGGRQKAALMGLN